METTTIRVWNGVQQAVAFYAKQKGMDASTMASVELMKALFQEDDLPESAKKALAQSFFKAIGEGIAAKLAEWVVTLSKADRVVG